MAKTWTLVNYFDNWYNDEEGWTVNNLCIEHDDIQISEDASNQDIIDFLYNIEFFNTNDISKFNVVDWGDMIEISNAETGEPLCRLQPNY